MKHPRKDNTVRKDDAENCESCGVRNLLICFTHVFTFDSGFSAVDSDDASAHDLLGSASASALLSRRSAHRCLPGAGGDAARLDRVGLSVGDDLLRRRAFDVTTANDHLFLVGNTGY